MTLANLALVADRRAYGTGDRVVCIFNALYNGLSFLLPLPSSPDRLRAAWDLERGSSRIRASFWFIAAKGPAPRPARGFFNEVFATLGDRVMREGWRRIVAMVRVACHVERSAGGGAMIALVWHKKHIEERTGRGILPVIKSRMADVDSVGSRRSTRENQFIRKFSCYSPSGLVPIITA